MRFTFVLMPPRKSNVATIMSEVDNVKQEGEDEKKADTKSLFQIHLTFMSSFGG